MPAYSTVVVRLDRATQYSSGSKGLRRGRGVLDSRLSRGMTAEDGATSVRLVPRFPIFPNDRPSDYPGEQLSSRDIAGVERRRWLLVVRR